MKRKFTTKLVNWQEKNIDKPLIVVGARQIGKTYTINEFCNEHFEDYVYINLEQQADIREIFDKSINPVEIMELIQLHLKRKIDINKTILFFDECQVSEKFIMSLKYFCEDPLPYKIICAGSLLGVKINRFSSSFPVGKVRIEYMYPMDFLEFLWAMGEDMLIAEINKCFFEMKAMDNYLHSKAIKLYKQYLCVGGMPEAVSDFVRVNCNIMDFDDNISRNIIDMYLADMNKYTSSALESVKIEMVYKNVPSQLAKDSKRFRYSDIEKGSDKRKFQSSIDWLISSSMVYSCYDVEKVEIPLNVYKDINAFKLYLSDVGLLTRMSGLRYEDVILDVPFMYRGVLTENYVAQNFVSSNLELYYWTSKNKARVDFLLYNKDGIIPIEVKSSNNNQSKSLKLYMDKYKPKYGIRLSCKNFGYENNIKAIPLYAIFCLENL